MQKIRILTELSPAQRKPHGLNSLFPLTHVLCQEWSCRYFLRHETKNWSHFTLSCCYIAGILFLIWGKPSAFYTKLCLASLKGTPCFGSKYFSAKINSWRFSEHADIWHEVFLWIFHHLSARLNICTALIWGKKRPIWFIWGKIPIVYTTIKNFLFQYLR